MSTYGERNALLLSIGFPSYQSYLTSPIWLRVKCFLNITLQENECKLCGRPWQVYHHLRYDLLVLTGLDPDGVVRLCHRCHERVEFRVKGSKRIKRPLVEVQEFYRKLLRAKLHSRATRKRQREAATRIGRKGWCSCGNKARKGSCYCRPCESGVLPSKCLADVVVIASSGVAITQKVLDAGRSRNGSWSAAQLRWFGLYYPLIRGWQQRLIGQRFSQEIVDGFLRLKDAHLVDK